MINNTIIKSLLYLIVCFLVSFSLYFIARGVVPALISLRSDLAAPTQQIVVIFFTYNMLVKIHSGFLALSLLTGVEFMVYLILLSVKPSGVETIAASIISLNCYWSSHFPAFWYNFLIF